MQRTSFSDCSICSSVLNLQSPTFNKVFEVKAHSQAVDDIAVSTQDESVVTISKDGKASVWTFEGKHVLDLQVDLPTQAKYIYRNCRFDRSWSIHVPE